MTPVIESHGEDLGWFAGRQQLYAAQWQLATGRSRRIEKTASQFRDLAVIHQAIADLIFVFVTRVNRHVPTITNRACRVYRHWLTTSEPSSSWRLRNTEAAAG